MNWTALSSSFLSKLSNSKKLQTNGKTLKTDCDNKQFYSKQQHFNKLELWLGITFYTAPRWEPDDPAG